MQVISMLSCIKYDQVVKEMKLFKEIVDDRRRDEANQVITIAQSE